jgi:hypothetical protein
MKKVRTEKSLKPSQRESITAFSKIFGTGTDYRSKALRRKIARIIIIVLLILALVYAGFFLTDVLLRVTELPPDDETASETQIIDETPQVTVEAVSPPID